MLYIFGLFLSYNQAFFDLMRKIRDQKLTENQKQNGKPEKVKKKRKCLIL